MPLLSRVFRGSSVGRDQAVSRHHGSELAPKCRPVSPTLFSLSAPAGTDSRTLHAPITRVTRAAAASHLLSHRREA